MTSSVRPCWLAARTLWSNSYSEVVALTAAYEVLRWVVETASVRVLVTIVSDDWGPTTIWSLDLNVVASKSRGLALYIGPWNADLVVLQRVYHKVSGSWCLASPCNLFNIRSDFSTSTFGIKSEVVCLASFKVKNLVSIQIKAVQLVLSWETWISLPILTELTVSVVL